MLIKEFRVVMPLTVEEYQIGQLYAVAHASKEETGGGEGVEVVKNVPYDDETGKGQYTKKIYHLSSKVPALIRVLMPSGALEIHEEAWNAYPNCKTILTNGYMKENFSLSVESVHLSDNGNSENVFNLSEEELQERTVQVIDIANDALENAKDYSKETDPSLFKSEKTGRGPLGNDWIVRN